MPVLAILANAGAAAHASPPAEKGPNRTLTVDLLGSGTGTVSSSPDGIDCGANCAASFKRRTSVTLTAAPAANSSFVGWSGGECTGAATSCTFRLTDPTTITATFERKPSLLVGVQHAAGTSHAMPGGWTVANGFEQAFHQFTVDAVDAAGARVTSFTGTVRIASNCPLAADGGASHVYDASDGGSHVFSLGLGDHVAFGATMGYAPVFDGTAGWRNPVAVSCTLTATETTGAALTAQHEVLVSGEYCDSVDNNANGQADLDAFPELGTAAPGGGTYRCSTDGLGLVAVG